MRMHPSIFVWLLSGTISCAYVLQHARKSVEFYPTNLKMSIPNSFDTFTSGLSSISRLPFGTLVLETTKRPSPFPQILTLYDIEACKNCRLVRERISELDLVVDTIIPAGPNSRVFTDENYKYYLGGRSATIPRMTIKDYDGQKTLEGSDEIIKYFTEIFGPRTPVVDDNEEEVKKQIISAILLVSENFPALLRLNRGYEVAGCALLPRTPRPSQPLVLYSYEGNQFCRLVREVLNELDIPYKLCSAGKGSTRRVELSNMTGGSTICPYLIDPNTETKMAESKDIIKYLYKTYATYTPPNELLSWVSEWIVPSLKPIFKGLAPLQAGSMTETKEDYVGDISMMTSQVENEISANQIVIYTYSLSPFCTEAIAVLENIGVEFKEISLGLEWLPFLISTDGAKKRAALGEMTGQTSLPHIFVNSRSIGGLYDGLVPALDNGSFWSLLERDLGYSIVVGKVGAFE